ncbi:MAG: UDP-4-amino-4,6-dideoxy-N-acetyl-beta-L-altrosamine transaminase [Pseudomonadota bacterium]
MIPYGKQSINQDDINRVVEVLKSDFLTQGDVVPAFEQAIADYCLAKYASAVCNATAALHLACLALGVGKGDIVWTCPNTFVASANCALYCGAQIDFVDINSQTYNLSVQKLKEKLAVAKKNSALPKVVIPVHFAGQSCEMKEIKELSKIYGFAIIEDASHAIGAEYLGKKVGSCQYSDISIFSFHPVKIMTTGEGGMLVTNHKKLNDKIKLLRSAGITKNPELMTKEAHGSWFYQQLELGFNYRMTDIQAALGLSQLNRLDQFIAKRCQIAEKYTQQLENLSLVLPYQHVDSSSSWHLYVLRLNLGKIGKSKKEIFADLQTSGIGVQIHYIPVHTQPFYQNLGFQSGDFPQSECYYKEAISIPLFYDMTEADIRYIVKTLKEIL